jgi:hypothetical protein
VLVGAPALCKKAMMFVIRSRQMAASISTALSVLVGPSTKTMLPLGSVVVIKLADISFVVVDVNKVAKGSSCIVQYKQ